MKISNSEKLILYMLAEIHEQLKIENGVDAAFVREALSTDNVWAIESTFTGIFAGREDELPEEVEETFAILSMWSRLEFAYSKLSPEDQQRVKSEANYGQALKFEGFDGNDEAHYHIADFIVNRMDRYKEFKDRDLNSHTASLSRYKRMLPKFKAYEHAAAHKPLTADAIVGTLKD